MSRTLSEQLDDHQRNRDDLDFARKVELETVKAAIEVCEEVCLEIGAERGSSIHAALSAAADRILKIAK